MSTEPSQARGSSCGYPEVAMSWYHWPSQFVIASK